MRASLELANKTWGEDSLATTPDVLGLTSVLCRLGNDPDEGLRVARALLKRHGEEEQTLARRSALEAVIQCAQRGDEQFAKEGWDLVYLSKQIYGEKHQSTLLSQTRYVEALNRAPHPENEALWKELLLATALSEEFLPGWQPETAIDIHGKLGAVAGRVAPNEVAIKHGEAILALAQTLEVSMVEHEARAHRFLCHAKSSLGHLDGALDECYAARELSVQLSDPQLRGLTEHSLGITLSHVGRDEEAVRHLETAVPLMAKSPIPADAVAKGFRALAEVQERLGRYGDALENFEASSKLLEGSGGIELLAARTGEARMAARLGRIEVARAMLEQLQREGMATGPYKSAWLEETRGYVANLEDPRKGRQHYAEALGHHVAISKTRDIRRLCRDSPFRLSECGRLGYDNPARPLVPR